MCIVRKSELLSNCIEFILQLVQLIKFSPKRLSLFQNKFNNRLDLEMTQQLCLLHLGLFVPRGGQFGILQLMGY